MEQKKPSNKYRAIFVHFEHMFPDLAKSVTHYSATDQHTIKLQTTAKIELIFTYIGSRQWVLKTGKDVREQNTSSNEK